MIYATPVTFLFLSLIWTICFVEVLGKARSVQWKKFLVEYDQIQAPGVRGGTVQPNLVDNKVDSNAFFNHLKAHLERNNVTFGNVHFLDSAPEIFQGLSISLSDPDHDKFLRTATRVTAVYAVQPIKRPTFALLPTVVSENQNSTSRDQFVPHVQVGVSRLHDLGYLCQGIRIAVIDTGCDCSHPALGGGFGDGHKIDRGYDFVGDDYNGENAPTPDGNPCTQCALHGTHTMGILAANQNPMGFSGVCPEAKMSAYRVFGCQEGTSDDLVVAALLRAYADGADVFSLSVGTPAGWADGSIGSIVASRIAASGPTVVVSAGNTGAEGMFYANSPSTGADVISVGSVQARSIVSYTFTTSATGSRNMYYFATYPMKPGISRVYPVNSNPSSRDDACQPLPSTTPNLSDYFVLVKRSSTPNCTLETQAVNLKEKGAIKIIWANNNSYPEYVPSGTAVGMSIGVVTVDVGRFLLDEAVKDPIGFTVNVTSDAEFSQIQVPDSGRVSPFSAHGPMYDFTSPQPAVLGVGGNVLSTYPLSAGAYAIASGTSMSAPQVAGIAALVLNVRGKGMSSEEMRSRIITSATPVTNYSGSSTLECGSGVVDAWCAAFSNTILSTYSIALNDTANFNGLQSIIISNQGNSSIKYQLKHEPAGTALTFPLGEMLPYQWPVPLIANAAKVSFSQSSFTLGPYEQFEFKLQFRLPTGTPAEQMPIYSGFIRIVTDTECESHTVPYYGAAAELRARPVLDTGIGYQDNYTIPALDSGLTSLPVESGHVFTLNDTDVPIIEYRLAFGTPLLLFHLVAEDADLKIPVPSVVSLGNKISQLIGRSNVPSYFTSPENSGILDTLKGSIQKVQSVAPISTSLKLLGSLGSHDTLSTWNPRHTFEDSSSFQFNGSVFDLTSDTANVTLGVPVPDGNYKILFRALRINGNPQVESDYEAWLSPKFTIKRTNQIEPQNDSTDPTTSSTT
ncbi:subtilisin protease [Melampsora larici-populina 98AG31]|uniref:Subtilisin protease n=1 Tax=Melampsora larici-populina (strain 98AG31 / pathotype 3-4-7) TaxID=747676 RepID=F4RSW0_MELLP|nr:subtilisin protease [Melampsora larici-populina 98AG31]EGG04536.1 subtilisin protease [Melampsora larici-populina 98AG31]